MKLISYVITHDYGFAPNPYFEYLTLATCKPKIRTFAKVGDVIIGSGSSKGIGVNKIVFVGIISEIIKMNDYFIDKRFENKKPNNLSSETLRGDNIYYKENDVWKQLPQKFHDLNDLAHDTSSENVLICDKYWFFGENAPLIPPHLMCIIKKGPAHKYTDNEFIVSGFMEWINHYPIGLLGKPSSLKKKL